MCIRDRRRTPQANETGAFPISGPEKRGGELPKAAAGTGKGHRFRPSGDGKNPGEVPGSQDALPQGDTVAGGFFADHPGQPVAAYLCQAVSGGQKLAGSGLCHRPLR